jgi:hypothetical protein
MEAIVAASSLLIGREVASQTISSTSSSIINRLGHINDNYGTDCEQLFTDLDIKFKIDIISSYISKIHDELMVASCGTISKCVEFIKETLIEIEQNMQTLQNIKTDYDKQWFGNAISSSKFTTSFNNIKIKVIILDQRFDMLMKLIS